MHFVEIQVIAKKKVPEDLVVRESVEEGENMEVHLGMLLSSART